MNNINKVYEQQINELKAILMEEVVKIHQKFNMIISEGVKSDRELEDVLKREGIKV